MYVAEHMMFNSKLPPLEALHCLVIFRAGRALPASCAADLTFMTARSSAGS